eukprot:m.89080 g.89080  ORF g.89080 m.89080 type:complete len:456 (-) comp11701_c0_seq3:2005-3372(-)
MSIGGKGVLPPTLSITSQPSNLSHQSLEYCVFGQSHLECQESSGRTVVECVCGRSCQRGCRQKQLFSLKGARRSREEGGWKDAAHRGRGVGETGSRGHGELLDHRLGRIRFRRFLFPFSAPVRHACAKFGGEHRKGEQRNCRCRRHCSADATDIGFTERSFTGQPNVNPKNVINLATRRGSRLAATRRASHPRIHPDPGGYAARREAPAREGGEAVRAAAQPKAKLSAEWKAQVVWRPRCRGDGGRPNWAHVVQLDPQSNSPTKDALGCCEQRRMVTFGRRRVNRPKASTTRESDHLSGASYPLHHRSLSTLFLQQVQRKTPRGSQGRYQLQMEAARAPNRVWDDARDAVPTRSHPAHRFSIASGLGGNEDFGASARAHYDPAHPHWVCFLRRSDTLDDLVLYVLWQAVPGLQGRDRSRRHVCQVPNGDYGHRTCTLRAHALYLRDVVLPWSSQV